MVKHTQPIRLSVFDHFVGLALIEFSEVLLRFSDGGRGYRKRLVT